MICCRCSRRMQVLAKEKVFYCDNCFCQAEIRNNGIVLWYDENNNHFTPNLKVKHENEIKKG